MLTSLTIKNIVLIEQLALSPGAGLTTLTGETGAGKSILLDALGLALGARADAGLVRKGADKGSVSALFECPAGHPACLFLAAQDIDCDDGQIILRRSLTSEGRSKASVNDQPVSIGLLKELGGRLVEIHGQFEASGLLESKNHRRALDQFGQLHDETVTVKTAYTAWQDAHEKLENARSRAQNAKAREDYVRYCVEELAGLAPKTGEEIELTAIRNRLMHREKIADTYNRLDAALSGENGLSDLLGGALAAVEKIENLGGTAAGNIIAALNRARVEIEDAAGHLSGLAGDDDDTINPNDIEERLFALKDCARKHNVSIDELPEIRATFEEELALVDDLEASLNRYENAVKETRTAYLQAAQGLHERRTAAAAALEKTVMKELPDLKLDRAGFFVTVMPLDQEAQWGPHGIDRIVFEVSTNPGTAPGPIHKIASGGELSRFMLALKLALAETSSVRTLVFDEVDSGVGGATADAVGLRLKRLSLHNQILVVTHSPQVAAKGARQLQIAKSSAADTTTTKVTVLSDQERLEEIARMISGSEITPEARAAAARLISAEAA